MLSSGLRVVGVVGIGGVEFLESRRLMAFALDAEFGESGDFNVGNASFDAIANAGSGKIWVGGQKAGRPVIARLTSAGQNDPTFNGGAPLTFGSAGQSVRQLVALIGGKLQVNLGNAVTRLKSDGSPDTTFGNAGTTRITNNRSISIDSTGIFYATGNTTIARYNAAGRIDSAWASNGTFNYTAAPGFGALLTDIQSATLKVRAAPGGRVMLAVSDGKETPRFGVLRLSSSGSLNTTFAGDGTYVSPATFNTKSLTDFAVLPDSQSMLLIDREDGVTETLALDGKGTPRDSVIDPADTTRKNLFRFAGGLATNDQATTLAITPTGEALITGGFEDPFAPNQFAGGVARVKPDFTLDRDTAPDGDGVIAVKRIEDTSTDPDYAGQPVTRAAQFDANTIYAIINNQKLVRLRDGAIAPGVSNVGGRISVNATTADDFISVSGQSNQLDISINGERFSADSTVLTKIEISGGAGNDLVNVSGSFPADSIVVGTRNGRDRVTINRTDTIVPVKIYLGSGDDYAATNMPSVIYGEGENDTLIGSSSIDALFGGDGADSLVGNADNDYIEGNAGNDFIDGSAGNDRILGHEGNDNLLGGRGNDTMYGHDGRDTLVGNQGRDYLDAGTGNDILYTRDSATDRVFGAGGNDSANRDKADILDGIESFI